MLLFCYWYEAQNVKIQINNQEWKGNIHFENNLVTTI